MTPGIPFPLLPRRQLEIMHVLWESEWGLTVAQVQERINREGAEPEIAYRTVLTHLRILVSKGRAGRSWERGRHVYYPRGDRAADRKWARLWLAQQAGLYRRRAATRAGSSSAASASRSRPPIPPSRSMAHVMSVPL